MEAWGQWEVCAGPQTGGSSAVFGMVFRRHLASCPWCGGGGPGAHTVATQMGDAAHAFATGLC